MEHCDGNIPANRPKLSDGGGCEDRLSALHDDLLIKILVKLLDAAVAARTSVLSSRWRRLWTLLPELYFYPHDDPQRIHLALQSHQAPVLRRLGVALHDAPAESVAAWLPVAARRLSGVLCLINKASSGDMTGALELPCFEHATSVCLSLDYIHLAVPPSGVFPQLTELYLDRIKLCGPDTLGDAVSWPRCPVLEKLTVDHTWGVGNFAIHSDSLQEIELRNAFGLGNVTIHSKSLVSLVLKKLQPRERKDDHLGLGNFTIHSESLLWMNVLDVRGIRQLNVVAPSLQSLNIGCCFARGSRFNQPLANICAPRLMSLLWKEAYDPSSTNFGNMENLSELSTFPFRVYGDDSDKLPNNYCLRLLRRFQHVHSLRLILSYMQDLTNQQYLMEDITRLPDITSLVLDIHPEGHSVGACVFHVLRMCTGARKLLLTLYVDATSSSEEQTACPSGCVCNQPPNWKTEEVALNRLQEVAIHDLVGTEHEAALVKRLFDWATVLQTMTITINDSVPESKAKEFCQLIQSFSKPEICLRGPHFA